MCMSQTWTAYFYWLCLAKQIQIWDFHCKFWACLIEYCLGTRKLSNLWCPDCSMLKSILSMNILLKHQFLHCCCYIVSSATSKMWDVGITFWHCQHKFCNKFSGLVLFVTLYRQARWCLAQNSCIPSKYSSTSMARTPMAISNLFLSP